MKENRNIIILGIVLIVAGSAAGVYYWQNRDLCLAFSQKDVETTCEEARDLALQAYPGKTESIRLQEELTSERDITPQPYWLVKIRLASPLYFEKFQRDVQRMVVKVTMGRGVDLYNIGE